MINYRTIALDPPWLEDASPGPRLEMFARGPREGWDVWGNESNA